MEFGISRPDPPLFLVTISSFGIVYSVTLNLFLYSWYVCHIFFLLSTILTRVSYTFCEGPIGNTIFSWKVVCTQEEYPILTISICSLILIFQSIFSHFNKPSYPLLCTTPLPYIHWYYNICRSFSIKDISQSIPVFMDVTVLKYCDCQWFQCLAIQPYIILSHLMLSCTFYVE